MAPSNAHQHDRGNDTPGRLAQPAIAHLRSFLCLARHGSMTAAAEELGVSPPTISDHIDQLERGFEDKLFIRGPMGFDLTATGEALRRRVEHSINQLDHLTFENLPRPVILGGPADLLRERVLPSLASLLSPDGISVQIQPGSAEELLEQLRNRTIDLFVAVHRFKTRDIKVKYHRLSQEQYVLVGNADWRKRLPPTASEGDAVEILAEASLLAYDEDLSVIRDHPLIGEHEDAILGADPLARVALIMADFAALRNVAIEGGGVTVLPSYVADEAIGARKLFDLYEPQDRKFNPLYLAHRDEPQSDAVLRIVEELRRKAPTWATKAAAVPGRSRGASAPAPFYESGDDL